MPRLCSHLHQNIPGFRCISHFPQECDSCAAHAILGFQANVKAEPVDRSHHRFLSLYPRECPGQRDERAAMIGIHVLDDAGCGVGQRVGLPKARDRLSEYVADVERTHERVTITRHGHPAAVLISVDDLASIEETLEILGTPGAVQAIQEGQADAAAGRFANNDEIKARYGVA